MTRSRALRWIHKPREGVLGHNVERFKPGSITKKKIHSNNQKNTGIGGKPLHAQAKGFCILLNFEFKVLTLVVLALQASEQTR